MNHKIYFLSILIFLTSCLSPSIISDFKARGHNQFPSLTGINLNEKIYNLPNDFEGDINLITIAFKHEQQTLVNTWINFSNKILPDYKNLNFYEIPFIYPVNRLKRTIIQNGMRGCIKDNLARSRTITIFAIREPFFELMKMNKNNIYTLLFR